MDVWMDFLRHTWFLLLVLVGVMIWSRLQKRATHFSSPEEFEQLTRAGTPVLAEFFTLTCPACIAAQPVMRRLRKELAGLARVVHLNAQSPVGSRLAQQYRIAAVPTLLIFDGKGRLVRKDTGVPDADYVIAVVARLVKAASG